MKEPIGRDPRRGEDSDLKGNMNRAIHAFNSTMDEAWSQLAEARAAYNLYLSNAKPTTVLFHPSKDVVVETPAKEYRQVHYSLWVDWLEADKMAKKAFTTQSGVSKRGATVVVINGREMKKLKRKKRRLV